MARAVLGVWGAAGAFSARAGTARALGRWVEGTRAVHHRLGMVSALACPLVRAPELPVYGMLGASIFTVGCEWHTFTPPVHVPDTSTIHDPQSIIPL